MVRCDPHLQCTYLSPCRLLTTLVDKVVSADGTELLRSYIEVGGDGMPSIGDPFIGWRN